MFALAALVIVVIAALVLRQSLHNSLRQQMHQELQFRHSLMVPYISARESLSDWVTVSTKLANWTTVEGGHTHYWVISDIEASHLARLFERFYRVDAARTRSDTQHGLGLSIVRAVALMHHGDVFASSEKGINCFGFSLAIEPAADVKNCQLLQADNSVSEASAFRPAHIRNI